MRSTDIISAVAPLAIVWLGYFLAPHIMSLTGALGVSAAVATYPIGMYFRKKRASKLPVMASGGGQNVFPVQRRGLLWFGYFAVMLGVAACGMIWAQIIDELGMLLAAPGALISGVFCVLMARNVREIRVDDHDIRFLPVGASLPLAEVVAIKNPGRGSAPTHIELSTKTIRSRYVPGALLQWDGGCRLTIVGSNGNAILSALRERLPSA